VTRPPGEPRDVSPAPPRVVTAGETMALLDPVEDGELALGSRLTLRIAGAESNFAVGLARLGVPVAWISRLGDDRPGALVREALAAEGVDLRWAVSDPDAPTGLFYKWRTDGRTSVAYYRHGSAASRLSPVDLPDEALRAAAVVHLSGITLALGDGPRALVHDLARRARAAGATVTFDPNYRPALWRDPTEAAGAITPLLGDVDWLLCGATEAETLFGTADPAALTATLSPAGGDPVPPAGGDPVSPAGPDVVSPRRGAVVRVADRGSLVAAGGAVEAVAPPPAVDVVDEVGAGDAFAAGFVYGLLNGWAPAACARAGHVIAGYALRGSGDWETLPRLDEVRDLLG
jgi:2-dehydro-3-deoxygluconokinase